MIERHSPGRPVRVHLIVVVALLATCLAACLADDPSPTAPSSTIVPTVKGAPSSSVPPSVVEPTAAPPTTFAHPRSPIDQILPFLELSEQQRRVVGLEYGRRLEAHLASCMAGEGFPYIPIDPDQPGLTGTPEGIPATPEEMAEQYGYGVVLSLRLSFQPIATEIDDPNVAIYDGLSSAEQDAYRQSHAACAEEALGTYPDPFGSGSEGEVWLANQLVAIQEAVLEDLRVQQAVDRWSSCMAEQGFDFADPDDARAYVEDLVTPIANAQAERTLDDATAAELDRLQQVELEVADTDFACAEQLNRAMDEVRYELETELIEREGPRIAAYADTYAAAIADYIHLLDE